MLPVLQEMQQQEQQAAAALAAEPPNPQQRRRRRRGGRRGRQDGQHVQAARADLGLVGCEDILPAGFASWTPSALQAAFAGPRALTVNEFEALVQQQRRLYTQ